MDLIQKIDSYKAAIDKQRPFEGELLKQLRDYYRIGLTWSSNAIEGNTLTISETKVVLEEGLTVGGRPLRDFYETVGHGEAYDFMFSLMQQKDIDENIIKELHRLFYRHIDEAEAGRWRRQNILVSGTDYAFPSPDAIESEIQGLTQWIKEGRRDYHPVKFAALLHLKFVSIHPFIDGNGRTARLLMNLSLLQDGYQLAIIPPVCRLDYNAFIRKYQEQGSASQFIAFIAERVLESEKEIMRLLHIDRPQMPASE